MAVDAVYPLGTGSRWDNNELRYSLRALEKNFLDLGRVFIVGRCPPWLTGAVHLDVPDSHKHNKDANLIDKVLAACRAGVSDKFVRSSDDQLILRPCHADDLKPYHHGDFLSREAKQVRGGWKQRLLRTCKLLRSLGMPTRHHDTHIPTIYDRDLFVKIVTACNYRDDIGYTINTLYHNQSGVVDPPKMLHQKLTLERRDASERSILKRLEGKMYLGYNDLGLSKALKNVLQEMFPEPSRFEDAAKQYVRAVAIHKKQVIAVVGAARSGASCVAGIVHQLGVSMGDNLRKPKKRNPTGFFEDVAFRKICSSNNGRVKKLTQWANGRFESENIIGCKDAKTCNMIPEMRRAFPSLKVIAVDRPLRDIVASMKSTGTFKRFRTDEDKAEVAKGRIGRRDRDLAAFRIPSLRLSYPEVIADPKAAIEKIASFIGISPTQAQADAAMRFVDSSLQHHAGEIHK